MRKDNDYIGDFGGRPKGALIRGVAPVDDKPTPAEKPVKTKKGTKPAEPEKIEEDGA